MAIALFGIPTFLLIPARISTVTIEIWQQLQYPPNVELACAFSICLVVFTSVALLVQRRLLSRKGFTTLTGKAGHKQLIDVGGWRWIFLGFCLLMISLSLFLPVYVLLRTSLSKSFGRSLELSNLTLQWFQEALFEQPIFLTATQNTLVYAAAAATLAMVIALMVSYLVKTKPVGLYRFLGFMPMLPVVIPGIVIAVGVFSAYSRPPLVLYGSGAILIAAFTIRFLPFAFSNSRDVLRSVNPELDLAARNLGATQLETIQKSLFR
ncbi:MAG: hypothetical protein HC772_13090 [Leptolyngbyaceae cyanobacterium CRU_2_3]|nr:hypothetical protein [Leptolyngbyaceae cyanobacterium CRU_2_3]